MEIIVETKVKTCPYCGTKMKYTHEDIRLAWITEAPFISCPVCNNRLFDLK